MSDGPDDDEDETQKKTNGKKDETTKEKKKTSSNENEPEAGEVPDAPRALHRTLSIFFRHLPTQTTKEELENVTKNESNRFVFLKRFFYFDFSFVSNTQVFVAFVLPIRRLNESLIDAVG